MQDLRTIWETYVSAWKPQPEPDKRAIFARCLSPECVYTDPLTQARGWNELATYMASFHENAPGAHFVTRRFLAHHRHSIAHWAMVGEDGTALGEGSSYGEYDAEGRLLTMTGFFDVPGSRDAP